jgi:hypothetical protein
MNPTAKSARRSSRWLMLPVLIDHMSWADARACASIAGMPELVMRAARFRCSGTSWPLSMPGTRALNSDSQSTRSGQRFRWKRQASHRGQIALLARDGGGVPASTDFSTFLREAPAAGVHQTK